MPDVCPCLDFSTVSALFVAWSSGKSISIVVLPALIVLISETVFLEELNPAGHLPLKVLKTHEPG
jgi:hypothetical protein